MADLLEEYKEIIHEPRCRVICWTCGQHIYDLDEMPLEYATIKSSLFKPARADIPAPKPMEKIKCPLCGGNFMTPAGFTITSKYE